jgi:hypothetical protein
MGGFIFTVDGQRIYLAGDTDHIPEMKDFRVDIALPPVSGTYVMTADEAVRRPSTSARRSPFNALRRRVGDKSDAERFAEKAYGKDCGSDS